MTAAPAAARDASAASAGPGLDSGSTPATLRVAGVDPELGFGGGETQVLGLTLELLRAGHRAELVCDAAGALFERARRVGVVCHAMRIRNSVDFVAGARLRALLAPAHYDVVHFHTSRAHAMAPYVRGSAGALVVTRRMDYAPNRLFAPWLYNRAVDGVAAISDAVADALARSGVTRDRVKIIPSGVDCERFQPPAPNERQAARAALSLAPDYVAVGAVAMLEPRKGHRFLLEAMALARRRDQAAEAGGAHGAARLRCLIAGDGSQRDALVADAKRLGLDDAVRFLGRVDNPRELLCALDIFVMPSLYEGLGVAALEAMACGLPVIASDTGGLHEAVEDGRTGLLAPPGDVVALAHAIETLAEAPAMRAAMGAAARDRAVERFGMTAMARRTLEFYRVCMARAAAEKR